MKKKIKEGDYVKTTDKVCAYCKVHIIVGKWARCTRMKYDGTAYKYPWFVTHTSSLTKLWEGNDETQGLHGDSTQGRFF